MEEENITELARQVVDILAVAKNPEYIINVAKERHSKHINHGMKKITEPEKNVHWVVIQRQGSWWIEYNKNFNQYRLIGGPNKTTYFSILIKKKLIEMLNLIIEIGNEQNGEDMKSSMTVFQVSTDSMVSPKKNCKLISLEDAQEKYPESKDLATGFYTIHPCNSKALTPIENYFTNLALDKDNECIVLLGKMGAKKVRIYRNTREKKDNNFDSSFGLTKKSVNAGLNSTFSNELNSETDFEVEFSGNQLEFSKDLLRNSIWFKNDSQMNGLLDSLLSKNPPKDWNYVENMSSTFNFDFSVAASILGVFEASLKNDFSKVSNLQRTFHVEFN